jgi:hypothetical protein
MANANAPLEFAGGQADLVSRLALLMKGVAAVLLLLAGINAAGGAATLIIGAPAGLLAILEGLVTALLGLIMLASSADVRFMAQTKFASIHLGNAIQNLAFFYKVQFLLALALSAVAIIRFLVS